MFARLFRWFSNVLFAIFSKREVIGLDNLPPQGPYILVANHLSRLDLPLGFGILGSERTTGWVASKYRRHPLFGWIVRLGHGIFIRRGEVDRDALAAAIAWLRQGNVFGMSPEGTRSKTGSLIRAKTGAAYLANQVDVPIIPVAITGTEKMMANLIRLRRTHVTISFGEPFRLLPIKEEERGLSLRQNTDEIMCRIAALLPPAYRGVYSDHPRLKALLDKANA